MSTYATRTLPSYWACYLINGDASGLDDDEQQAIDEFFEDNPELGPCVGAEELGFARSNDWAQLGAEVSEFTFLVREMSTHREKEQI